MTVYAPEFGWIMYHHSIKETKHIKSKTPSLDGLLCCIVFVEDPGIYNCAVWSLTLQSRLPAKGETPSHSK